jgi:hypothetical protein
MILIETFLFINRPCIDTALEQERGRMITRSAARKSAKTPSIAAISTIALPVSKSIKTSKNVDVLDVPNKIHQCDKVNIKAVTKKVILSNFIKSKLFSH